MPMILARVVRWVRLAVSVRRVVAGATLAAVAACGDATGPGTPGNTVDGAAVLPAVEDTRVRLVPVIGNSGVRDRIAYDMLEIEAALRNRDGQKARYHLRIAGGILLDYRAGMVGVNQDGPDVGGIALTLHAVSVAAGGTFDIAAFR
jgi:hypothetical protein